MLRRKADRSGAAAVEMAMVAPVILLMAFAVSDYGRIVHAYLVVSNAARCGADYAAVHGFTTATRSSWETCIREAVDEELQNLPGYDVDDSTVEITTSVDADDVASTSVSVTYPFRMTITWPGLPSSSMLSHRVEMRRIQ